jgi:hypothetical protein
LYGVLLVFGVARLHDIQSQQSLWDLQDTGRFLDWIVGCVTAGLVEVALFVLFGFLLWLSWRGDSSVAHGLFVFLSGFVLTLIMVGICIGGFPDNLDLLSPIAGYVLGTWVGSRWLRGTRARLWLVPQLALFLLVVAAGAAGFVLLAVEDEPLAIEAARVTSAEKRRLVELLRSRQEGHLNGVAIRSLRLEEKDVDLILAWGLSLGSAGRKAKARLGEAEGALSVSVEVPGMRRDATYFNLQAAAQCNVQAGNLGLRLQKLQMGRVDLPRFILSFLSPLAVSIVERDPNLRRILAYVESLRIEPGALEVVYREGAFLEVPALLERLGAKDNVLASTEILIGHLLLNWDQLPEGEKRLGALVEAAFELARESSRAGSPSSENRAAIYALGVLAGHHRVADLIGLTFNDDTASTVRRGLGRVTLRGRTDWTRHFFVSAALDQISAESASDAVGLLKEELDAGEEGSGFSFSDLLADRAGTLFSLAATRDDQAALAMQARLSRGFYVDDFFPPAGDLPEGVTDEQLQAQYGGVGGARYRQIEQEIERRLAGCAGLK